MEVLYLDERVAKAEDISVALGYFDGVHLGHQAVILDAVRYGKEHGIKSAVLTFSTNPKVFLKKSQCSKLLTPLPEKVKILEDLGVDQLLILPFDEKTAQLDAHDFIQVYLLKRRVRHVSTGFDFRFGKFGSGDVHLLKTYATSFSLDVTPKLELEHLKIGTTQIKAYLDKGQMQPVYKMLGRPYAVTGIVVKGRQKGREIGFPTANVKLNQAFIVPQKGVYAVKVTLASGKYAGMCNIGHNPTFNFTDELSIEVNVLDFNEEIYGQEMRVEFIKRLRPEQRFSSIGDLMTQLQRDRHAARKVIKDRTRPGLVE